MPANSVHILAGELNRLVQIEQATETQSESGEVTQTWNTYCNAKVAIEPLGGGETWRAMQVNPLLTHQITMRYRPGITSKMRIRWDDPRENRTRYFEIDSARNIEERGIKLVLLCVEDADN